MIRAIEMINLKGQTGMQPLTGRDLFIGSNGSGKTTRIQALEIAMMGHTKNGKTSAETIKLATDQSLSAGLKIDGFQFTRTFAKKFTTDKKSGATKVSIEESISISPGRGEKNNTQKNARIKMELGDFPIMLDFEEFLAMSDAKRRDFIYSLSPIASVSWNRVKIHEHLRKILLTEELLENNPEQFQVMLELIDKAMEQYPQDYSVQDGLLSMKQWVFEQLSIWEAKRKDAQGAVRQISEMKNELEETDRNILEAKTDLEELRRQLVDVEKRISADMERKKNNDRRSARITELSNLIITLRDTPVNTETADLDKAIAEYTAKTVLAPNVNEKLAGLKSRIGAAKKQADQVREQRNQVDSERQKLRTAIQALEEAVKAGQGSQGRCALHSSISCTRDFTDIADKVKAKRAEVDKAIEDLTEQQYNVLTNQLTTAEQEVTKLENEREQILQNAQQINRDNQHYQTQINELEKQRNDRVNAGQRVADQLKLYDDERTRLMNEPVEAIGPIEVMEKQAEGIRARITELTTQVEEKEKARQSIILLQQSMIDNKKAEYNSGCLKLIAKELGAKGIQGEIVKEILAPIRRDIKDNLQTMGIKYDPFFQTESDTGQEIFQFGWVNKKGHQVNFDVLSTGQRVLFLAAMVATIIDRAQPTTRVMIIDDINHLDRENIELALNGINKLQDKFDNIILAGAVPVIISKEKIPEGTAPEVSQFFVFKEDLEATGWKVWDMDEPTAAAEVSKSA